MKRPYWVSWWDDPHVDFELRYPWWATHSRIVRLSDIVGTRQYSITAAVMATSPDDAKREIEQSYPCEVYLEWLFVEEQPLGWSPFNDERPERPGMIWDQRPH